MKDAETPVEMPVPLEEMQPTGEPGEIEVEHHDDWIETRTFTEHDTFQVMMITVWNDVWTWNKVDYETAQEVYKMLGNPDNFVSAPSQGVGPGSAAEAGAPGGEAGAE